MKNVHALLFAALLLLPGAARAAPKPAAPDGTATVAGLRVKVRGSAVVVDAGNNDNRAPMNLQINALPPFTALLRAYPHARTVNLSWFEPFMMDAQTIAVLYDRTTHTVTVHYSCGGGIDPLQTGKAVFTGVRESVFAAMLQAHPNGVPDNDPEMDKIGDRLPRIAGPWGGFEYLYLPRYGCRLLVPKARHGHRRLGRNKSA